MERTLEELKEDNKKLEEAEQEKLKNEVPEELEDELEEEEELDDEEEEVSDEDELEDEEDSDEEEEDSKEEKELEPWMKAEDDKDDKDSVPVGKHVEMKHKLRGRLKEQDAELEKLRKENELLKQNSNVPKHVEKPNPDDYTDQAAFDADFEKWQDYDTNTRLQRINAETAQQEKQRKAKAALMQSVDEHYTRGAELVDKSGIAPELFKQTDLRVRKTIEDLRPGFGEVITDNLIATLGKGSEKVMYYLGVNETALNKLQSLLISDPSGMKAAVFLGQEKQRLTTPSKKRSNAPKPSKRVAGDAKLSGTKSLQRKYAAAHRKGNVQLAYDIKQQAKKNKINTSNW